MIATLFLAQLVFSPQACAFQNGFPKAPASLLGSHASQELQNKEADCEGLERIPDEKNLKALVLRRELVPLPRSTSITIDPRLEKKWHFTRPWTARFVLDIAEDFYEAFHKPIQINSAVRTMKYQRKLQRINANAVSSRGERASSHLTGATIDIAKKKMSSEELVWMRERLLALEEWGLIEATEEFHQSVFHVMVFKVYGEIV